MADPLSPLLETRNICKYFAGVRANHNINLEIRSGEVHALLGENGAGKTTLMNILYGLYTPASGEIFWKGRKIKIKRPKDAIDLGIGMVHQHFMLIPALSAVENLVLGTKNGRLGLLNLEKAAKTLASLAGQYRMKIDPWARAGQLTLGQRQKLEILKILYKGAELLILDEPTSVLTPGETEELFLTIKKLTAGNRAVIFISHKLNEIMAVSDRVTVLRRGETVHTVNTADTDRRRLARLMTGREVSMAVEKKPCSPGKKILEIRDLLCDNGKGAVALNKLSLDIRGGEIVGIAGVDGSGQRELADAITGLCPVRSGSVRIDGYEAANRPPGEILERRVAHIPEDRDKRGLVLSMNLGENMMLTGYNREPLSRHGILRPGALRSFQERLCAKYRIEGARADEPVERLSGGIRQKIVLARELSKSPDLLIALYPMRGLDAGAAGYIRRRLLEERDRGAAVLFISAELEEIMSLSDRICVLYEGELMGCVPAAGAAVHEIGLMMAGAKRNPPCPPWDIMNNEEALW
jgi:simple sugar transport system ATP-binding protein